MGRGEELDGLGSVRLGEADWSGERSLTGEVRIVVMSGVCWACIGGVVWAGGSTSGVGQTWASNGFC